MDFIPNLVSAKPNQLCKLCIRTVMVFWDFN